MAKQIWMPEEGDRVRMQKDSKIEKVEQVDEYQDDSWSVQVTGKDEDGEDGQLISVVEYDEIHHYWKEDT